MNTRISDLNKEIDQLPKGVRAYYKKASLQSKIYNSAERRDAYLKDADAARKGKLTSTQKKVLIGGVAVAVVASGITYATMNQSGQLNSLKLRGEAVVSRRDFNAFKNFEFTRNPKLARTDLSPNEVLDLVAKKVNPLYDTAGGHMNCRRSSLTYELRRRGYDVRATTSAIGWGQSESGLINALTTDSRDRFTSSSLSQMVVGGKGIRARVNRDSRINPAKFTTSIDGLIEESKHVMPILAKQPSGARGEIVFNFQSFAHSMAYEIFDGKPVIFDSQKGVMYDAKTGIEEMTHKWGIPNGAEITRLDNMPLDLNFLSRWATNARS